MKPTKKKDLLTIHDEIVTPHDHFNTYISCLKELINREAQKLANKYESLPDESEGSEEDTNTYDRLLWTDDIIELIENLEKEASAFFEND